jgi:hypothetical protein
MGEVAVCMPVFNDWTSALVVVERVRSALAVAGDTARFLLVDDGSTESCEGAVPADVEVLHLRRNVGHQRAIAVGLVRLNDVLGPEVDVVVMDADGEDIPEQVPVLVDAARAAGGREVVFAKRTKRSEGVGFRIGYHLYRFAHRAMTGRSVEVGNFSVIPRSVLPTVVSVSEIWVHYAAGVIKARIPVLLVPLPRGERIAGRSKMNTVSLVGHGLGALSIFGEEIVVRSLGACIAGVVLTVVAAVVAAAVGSGPVAIVCAVAAAVFIAAGVQGVLAAVVLYRLKSMMAVVPIGDAHRWMLPEPILPPAAGEALSVPGSEDEESGVDLGRS